MNEEKEAEKAKEKEERQYAWMDSGDESVAGEDSGDEAGRRGGSAGTADKRSGAQSGSTADADRGGRGARKRSRSRSAAAAEDSRPILERLADVETFSGMVRLAPALQRGASKMSPKELAAVVTAAARVRFYDAEVFQQALLPAIKKQLLPQRSSGRSSSAPVSAFSTEEIVALITGLSDLNAHEPVVFSKAVEYFAERKSELEDPSRCERLYNAFRSAGHKTDADFVDYLCKKRKENLYQKRLSELQGTGGPQIYYGGLRK